MAFEGRITKRKLVAYSREFRNLNHGTFSFCWNRNMQRVTPQNVKLSRKTILWPFNGRITKRKLVAYYREFRKLTHGTFFYWSNRNVQRVIRPKTSNCCVSVLWPFNVRTTKRKLVAYYRKFRKLTHGIFFYWWNRNEQRVIRPKATNKLIRPHSCGLEVESPFKGKS